MFFRPHAIHPRIASLASCGAISRFKLKDQGHRRLQNACADRHALINHSLSLSCVNENDAYLPERLIQGCVLRLCSFYKTVWKFHQIHYFQHTLKMQESMNSLEHQAAEKLKQLLGRVPAIKLEDMQPEEISGDSGPDFGVCLRAFGCSRTLVCELSANGQPRHVRNGLFQLRNYVANNRGKLVPIFIAPYLSTDSQSLCREHEVGFFDLHGNAFISFDGIYIERLVASAPPAEKRKLKSLFAPKAAHVLLVMLRDPERAWRVAELAKASDVSLGHASNVRVALFDREWTLVGSDGISLAKPSALLDAWLDNYEAPAGKKLGYYTPLHGRAFEEAVRKALRWEAGKAHAALASYSAANWLAPYARTGKSFFYADDIGLEKLKNELQLSSASKGENVEIALPKEKWLFNDTVEPVPGFICTSPVRTYLDLAAAGERGREAAEHLRREALKW